MRTTLKTGIGVVALVAFTGASLLADVRSQEKTRMEFGGALVGWPPCSAARRPRTGSRQTSRSKPTASLTRMDDRGQLIDLAEEKSTRSLRRQELQGRDVRRDPQAHGRGAAEGQGTDGPRPGQQAGIRAAEENGHRRGVEGDRREEGGATGSTVAR